MEHRALGKGLSALIPEKVEVSDGQPNSGVTYLQTDMIRENSLQPRMVYDETKLAELVSSIKEKGILQPVLVRPRDDGYEIVAGQRRLLAARTCNMEKIPAIIKEVSDQESLVLALIENIQREELNAIEEAQAFQRLIEEFSLTHEEVAVSVGKERSTISNIMRLLKLPQGIQDTVAAGQLSMGHARALLSIEDAKLQHRLFERTLKKGISVRELENLTRSAQPAGMRREKKRARQEDPDLLNLQEELQQILGTKVRIVTQKKRGRVIIDYYSLDDLERILQIIRAR